jgi:hypothetical protein
MPSFCAMTPDRIVYSLKIPRLAKRPAGTFLISTSLAAPKA